MKLKDGLILREVGGQFIVMPTGRRVREIHSIVNLSSSAAYLWDYMKDNEFTVDDLADRILEKYDVDRKTAEVDIKTLIETLKKSNILEPEPGDAPVTEG